MPEPSGITPMSQSAIAATMPVSREDGGQRGSSQHDSDHRHDASGVGLQLVGLLRDATATATAVVSPVLVGAVIGRPREWLGGAEAMPRIPTARAIAP
jgi:hypothetical protein